MKRPLLAMLVIALVASAAAELSVLLTPRTAQAVKIGSTNANNLGGQPVCDVGVPQGGDPLTWAGTQWCNGLPNNFCLNARSSLGAIYCALFVDPSNLLELGDGIHAVTTQAGSPLQAPAVGVKWNNATDITEVNGPRSTVNFFSPNSLQLPGLFGNYTPSVNIHVRAIGIGVSPNAAGCTTSPVLEVAIATVGQAASAITIANGANFFNASGLNIAVSAGQRLQGLVSTGGVGCTTFPTQTNYSIEYTTD